MLDPKINNFTGFLSAPLISLLDENLEPKKQDHLNHHNFYNKIAEISETNNISLYEPSKYMEPGVHDYIRPEQIYQKNRDVIRSSDLLIAYVGIVSAGVAMEIEIANSFRVPVILLYENSAYNKISRMILGCRMANNQISADSLSELCDNFKSKLPHILNSIAEEKVFTPHPKKRNLVKQLIIIHKESTLSINQVAIEAGIDKSYISRLLNEKISNPGRDQIIRLCAWGWKINFDRTNELLRDAGYEQLW
jgi:hypothetical protein